MAFPNDLKEISTNLPFDQLTAAVDAINKKQVHWVPGSTSLVAEACYGEFDLDGARYSMNEILEEVCSIELISGSSEFVAKLRDTVEVELALLSMKEIMTKQKR